MSIRPALVDYLASTIDSFEKLEIVRALRAGERRLDDLRALVPLDQDDFTTALTALADAGVVVERTGVAELGPRAADPIFGELMAAYDTDRFAIAAALSKLALARVRTMTAKAFSSAFGTDQRKRGRR
jgi:hypothetical protein